MFDAQFIYEEQRLTFPGSVISATNTSHSSTVRTHQSARAVFKVASPTVSHGCTRKIADRTGLSMPIWTEVGPSDQKEVSRSHGD